MKLIRASSGLLLAATSTVLVLLAGEAALRAVDAIRGYQRPTLRRLMWSEPNFVTTASGSVTFAPNAQVREVAVYGDHIEYDMVHRTNNAGSADDVDYPLREGASIRCAFVGDSFLAGSGGHAWVSELRRDLEKSGVDAAIYQFAVPGAGFEHFRRFLSDNVQKLDVTDIVLFCISNDFYRLFWTPKSGSGQVFFCTDDGKTCAPMAELIDRAATPEEIIRAASESDSAAPGLLRHSRLFELLRDRWTWLRGRGRKDHTRGYKAMAAIAAENSRRRIFMFHLPTRQEVERGEYEIDVRSKAESLGFVYIPALHEFGWDAEMFHPNDPHPNHRGYDAIRRYVREWFAGPAGPLSRRTADGFVA